MSFEKSVKQEVKEFVEKYKKTLSPEQIETIHRATKERIRELYFEIADVVLQKGEESVVYQVIFDNIVREYYGDSERSGKV